MRMLKKVFFKNYKAFELGEIEIKPITVLLGANSVGKSSLMQLFLMLRQTAMSNACRGLIKLNGKYVRLGDAINLFRKKDKNNLISLGFELSASKRFEWLRTNLFDKYLDEIVRFSQLIERHCLEKADRGIRKKYEKALFEKGRVLNFNFNELKSEKDDLRRISDIIDWTSGLISVLESSSVDVKGYLKGRGAVWFDAIHSMEDYLGAFKYDKQELLLVFDLLRQLRVSCDVRHIYVGYDIGVSNNDLILRGLDVRVDDRLLIGLCFDDLYDNKIICDKGDRVGRDWFHSDFIDCDFLGDKRVFNSLKWSLGSIFLERNTIFYYSFSKYYKGKKLSVFGDYIAFIISELFSDLSLCFEGGGVNHVSPLRARPKRYYFSEGIEENISFDSYDGQSIVEILKEDKGLRDTVNKWLRRFGVGVSVAQVQDVLHKILVNQNDLDLDIIDVGFGISQVLPVIIQGFLAEENSITLIEQPEIHLHPKMQADLADLFIDMVRPKSFPYMGRKISKSLVVETHSEYLLNRLRRRIAEGEISADEVGIYLIDPQGADCGAKIKEVEIGRYGKFEWPKDFYEGELLNDTLVFLSKQK